MAKDKQPVKCSICGQPVENKGGWCFGNNAKPINAGRCCDRCDNEVVTPARIQMVLEARKE